MSLYKGLNTEESNELRELSDQLSTTKINTNDELDKFMSTDSGEKMHAYFLRILRARDREIREERPNETYIDNSGNYTFTCGSLAEKMHNMYRRAMIGDIFGLKNKELFLMSEEPDYESEPRLFSQITNYKYENINILKYRRATAAEIFGKK